jgi:hypothetical protein
MMATLSFTPNLHRHVESPSRAVAGTAIGEVLEAYFRHYPQVCGYVLDDQGDSWQTDSQHLPPIACVRFDP